LDIIAFLATILFYMTQALTYILLAYVILSWILSPLHPIRQALSRFVDPLLQPIRQILPQTGMFDLSPIVLFILLQLFGTLIQGFM